MKYRVDKYGNEISVLGYGCMRFTKTAGVIDMDKAERELMAAYHAGVYSINTKSIGIEIARSTSTDTKIKDKAIDNALTLIHLLKQEYYITKSNVITHKDASGKHCPHDIYDRYGIHNLYSEIKEKVEN